MRKSLVLCAAIVLCVNAAYATDFYWDCSTTGSAAPRWMATSSWNVGTGFPDDGTDRAIIRRGGAVNVVKDGLGAVFTVGEFIVDNGSRIYAFGSTSSLGYTMNVVDDCGLSGDFWHRSTAGVDHYGRPSIWNVDGNYFYAPTTWGTYVTPVVNLYGTNKGYRTNWGDSYSDQMFQTPGNLKYIYYLNIYGAYFDNGSTRSSANTSIDDIITVKAGGRVLGHPDLVRGIPGTQKLSTWQMHDLRLMGANPQLQLPALGENVTFRFAASRYDNNVVRWAVTGGVVYPKDVHVAAQYWGAATLNPTYNARIKSGDLTVGQDLRIETQGGTAPGTYYFTPEDNTVTSPVARNVTVYQDFYLGSASPLISERYGLKLQGGPNSSTIRVGRNLVFGATATTAPQNNTLIELGNGTIRVGGNFYVNRMTASSLAGWNPGTSTIIMDGNGTGSGNQILRTYGYLDTVPLNNLVVDSPTKSVVLDNANVGSTGFVVKPGGLRLKGNLTINSRFNDSLLPIAFNGPEHLLTLGPNASLARGMFDNIVLLPDAVMRLGSNIAMDNLDMQLGSKLYLNGFTLMAEGTTFVSSAFSAGGVPYTAYGSNGTIYGTQAIPEPATLLLLGSGVLGILGYARRRRMA